jgi:hypothetical protein
MAITRAQQVRQMLREGSEPMEQAGVMNYMPSEMVTVPRIAKSSPNTPTAKLAYITPEEQDILVKLNLYGSLKGKPNRGPGGIASLEGDFGSPTGQVSTSAGSFSEPGGTYSGGGAEYGGAGADYSGFVDTGTGNYVKIDPTIPVSDQTPTSFVDKVTDRIKGFGTGAKNYLSDPSNRKSMLTNVALATLFGPLGLLFSGLARTSKFQNMLSNLKGDDLLKGTSTIEFDKPVIDQRFRDGKNIINEPVVYNTDISDKVADVSQKDLDLMKTRGGKLLDFDTFKTITGNETLTESEFEGIRDGTIKAPTGIFA